MLAISPGIPSPVRLRIGAPALRRALVAGMRRVLEQRDHLNRINVFPVPDGDTGSNLAFTLGVILDNSLSRPSSHAGALLRAVAEDAIEGARGNSGAILAQFFCGFSEAVGEAHHLTAGALARAAQAGACQARAAIAQPREGTVLSVIQAFADALPEPLGDLPAGFGRAVEQARRALAETPRQLAVLRQAGVVDAGAQGFVDLVEGIHAFILSRKSVPASRAVPAGEDESISLEWHAQADAERPWCSECVLEALALDRDGLRVALQGLGADSVVLAGLAQRLRLHAHVADPGALFELVGRFGTVRARKAEDMRAQNRAAQRRGAVAVVTDSASDLPIGIGEQLPLELVPVRVSLGEEDFLDRVSISPAELNRRMRSAAMLPRTSQPPPGDFRRCFELLLAHTREVVYVGLTRALSGTLQAGEAAAARCPNGRVHVVDSGQVSCAQALLAMAAAESAAGGATASEVMARVEALKSRTFLFAAARDAQHAVRGGRIPAWVLPIARALGLTIIARMRADGRLAVRSALLGQRRVAERFARHVARHVPGGQRWRLMVGHCDAADDATVLLDALRRRLPIERDWLVETGPAIGAHAGPGTLVVGLQIDDGRGGPA